MSWEDKQSCFVQCSWISWVAWILFPVLSIVLSFDDVQYEHVYREDNSRLMIDSSVAAHVEQHEGAVHIFLGCVEVFVPHDKTLTASIEHAFCRNSWKYTSLTCKLGNLATRNRRLADLGKTDMPGELLLQTVMMCYLLQARHTSWQTKQWMQGLVVRSSLLSLWQRKANKEFHCKWSFPWKDLMVCLQFILRIGLPILNTAPVARRESFCWVEGFKIREYNYWCSL